MVEKRKVTEADVRRAGATTVAEWLSAAPVAFDAHAEPVAGELVPVISRAATLENLELARQMLARAMDFETMRARHGGNSVLVAADNESIRRSEEIRARVLEELRHHPSFTELAKAMGYQTVQPLHALVYARRGKEMARPTMMRIAHYLDTKTAMPAGEEDAAARREDEVWRDRLRALEAARPRVHLEAMRAIDVGHVWRFYERLMLKKPRPLTLFNLLVLQEAVRRMEEKS